MTTVISVEELKLQGSSGRSAQRIDVRSAGEFAVGHVPEAINIPLEQLEGRLADVDAKRATVLICQSGKRAQIAAGLLAGCAKEMAVLDGGTNAWRRAGLPIVRSTAVRWSLERQVRLAAGLLVLAGLLLAAAADWRWILLTAFVGLGLTFAGITNTCGMAELLGRMPWNKASHCKIREVKKPNSTS